MISKSAVPLERFKTIFGCQLPIFVMAFLLRFTVLAFVAEFSMLAGNTVDGFECYRCINLNYVFSNESMLNDTEKAALFEEYKIEEDRNPECRIGGNVDTYETVTCPEGGSCSDIHIRKPEMVEFFDTGEKVLVSGDERGCIKTQVPEGCKGPRCYCNDDLCNTDEIRVLYQRKEITCYKCTNLNYTFSPDSQLSKLEQDDLLKMHLDDVDVNPDCRIGGNMSTYTDVTCSYPEGSCFDIHFTKPELINFFGTGEMVTVIGDERGCTDHPKPTGCDGPRCYCKGDYCNTDDLRERVQKKEIKCYHCVDQRYIFSQHSKLSKQEQEALIYKYTAEDNDNPECRIGGNVSTYDKVTCSYPAGSCMDIHTESPNVVNFFGTGEMVTVVYEERGCTEHPRNSGCEGPRCYCKMDLCNTDELRLRYEKNTMTRVQTFGTFGFLVQCLIVKLF